MVVGSIWAWLYWRGDLGYALGIVLLHVVGAIGLAVAVDVLDGARRQPRLERLGFLGLAIGVAWVAPILLFVLDADWIDVTVSGAGLALAALVTAACGGLCAFAGNKLHRSSWLVQSGVLVALSLLAPLSSIWLSSRSRGPDVTVSDRVERARTLAPVANGPRMMILGIDGGNWKVIGSLVEQGRLPNLKRLMEKGQYGVLTSVATSSGDTVSPVVWTSIFSGVRPENHGITDWLLSDSRNRTRMSLWNILNSLGRKSILVNIPGSHPPERVFGAMISGFPIPSVVRASSSRFHVSHGRIYSTEPASGGLVPTTRISLAERAPQAGSPRSFSTLLEAELPLTEILESRYGRLRHPAYDLGLGNLLLELVERRGLFQTRELARYRLLLADQTDDASTNHDRVYLFPSSNNDEPLAVLEKGDWSDWISLRLRRVELKFKLRLMDVSASGVTLYSTPLFQSSAEPVIPFTYPLELPAMLSELGQYTVEGAGWTMYQDERMLDLLYEHVADVSDRHLLASKLLLERFRDWALFVHIFTESDRIQHSFWQFHQPELYPRLDPRLVLRHGDKVRSIHQRIDDHIGELLRFASEDTIVMVVSDHGFGPAPEIGRGAHTLDGLYIVAGKGVDASGPLAELDWSSLPRASVLDITPTALHLMGYPIGRDMDGRVFPTARGEAEDCCPIKWVDTYEGSRGREGIANPIPIDESMRDQLKSLGYIK